MDTPRTKTKEDPNYRILGPDEIIQQGDEYFDSCQDLDWCRCEATVGMAVEKAKEEYDFFRDVRRKADAPSLPPAPTVAIKHDSDKPAMALLPAEALEEVAKVLTFGANKYSAHNWRGGFAYTRILSAVLRHTFAFLRGEDKDPETGLSHLAHAICGLMFCLTFTKTKPELDDRYKAQA